MAFRDIPGQERAIARMQNAIRTGTLSHAYIFEGPKGTGRSETAQALAQTLYCEEAGIDACGTCAECRKIKHGNHPDVIELSAEGQTIKIEQVRDLQKRFANRASGAAPRIYIIRDAERMTPQAANALLKFLEEPSSATIAILITENGQSLLPTIRSRAQTIPFVRVSSEALEEALTQEGVPIELARAAARLGAGLAGCRELIQLNWFAETRNAVIQLGKESVRGFAASILSAQSFVIKSDVGAHMDLFFDLFALWCKDMILLQRGHTSKVVFIDQAEHNKKQAISKPARHWVEVMDEALQAKKRLRGHANPQLVLERFLHALQGGI